MTTILVALASVFAYGRLTKTRPTKVTYALATAAAYVAGFAIQLLLVAYAQGHLFTTQTEVKTFNSTAQGVLIVVGVATAVLVAWLRRGSPTKVDADSTPPSTRSRREHVTAQPSEYAQAGPALSSGFADLEIGDLVSIEPSRGSGPIVGSVATMWLKGLSVTSGPSMPEAGRSVSIRFEDIKTVARLAALPPADTGATTGLVDDSQSEAGVLALVNATDCAVHDLVPESNHVSVAETKICPDCAETVKAAARICRYCRFEFALNVVPATGEMPYVGGEPTDSHDIASVVDPDPRGPSLPWFTPSWESRRGPRPRS